MATLAMLGKGTGLPWHSGVAPRRATGGRDGGAGIWEGGQPPASRLEGVPYGAGALAQPYRLSAPAPRGHFGKLA